MQKKIQILGQTSAVLFTSTYVGVEEQPINVFFSWDDADGDTTLEAVTVGLEATTYTPENNILGNPFLGVLHDLEEETRVELLEYMSNPPSTEEEHEDKDPEWMTHLQQQGQY